MSLVTTNLVPLAHCKLKNLMAYKPPGCTMFCTHHVRCHSRDAYTPRQQPVEVALSAHLGRVPPTLYQKWSHGPARQMGDSKQASHPSGAKLHVPNLATPTSRWRGMGVTIHQFECVGRGQVLYNTYTLTHIK